MISCREEGCPEPVLFRDICSPSLPLRKWPGVAGGVGRGGGVGKVCQLSRSTHLGGSPLFLQLREKGRAGDGESVRRGELPKDPQGVEDGGWGGPKLTSLLCALEAAELQRVRAVPSSPPSPKQSPGWALRGYKGDPTSPTLSPKEPLSWEESARRSCQDQGWQRTPPSLPAVAGPNAAWS